MELFIESMKAINVDKKEIIKLINDRYQGELYDRSKKCCKEI